MTDANEVTLPMITEDTLKEIETQHAGFIDKPGASPGQLLDSGLILQLVAEIRALRAEVALARERLGPAGYKILEEHAELRRKLEIAREALGIMRNTLECIADSAVHVTEYCEDVSCLCCEKAAFSALCQTDPLWKSKKCANFESADEQ